MYQLETRFARISKLFCVRIGLGDIHIVKLVTCPWRRLTPRYLQQQQYVWYSLYHAHCVKLLVCAQACCTTQYWYSLPVVPYCCCTSMLSAPSPRVHVYRLYTYLACTIILSFLPSYRKVHAPLQSWVRGTSAACLPTLRSTARHSTVQGGYSESVFDFPRCLESWEGPGVTVLPYVWCYEV